MKHLIIYTHPNKKSFNHAIKEEVIAKLKAKGDEYELIDLYEDNFQPILGVTDFITLQKNKMPDDVIAYQDKITSADHLIFIYPIWWYGQPALLKGWIDRVFANGFAYSEDANGFSPMLKGKSATLFYTLGTPKVLLEQYGMETFMNSMTIGTLNLVGIEPVNSHPFHLLPSLKDEQRREMLHNISLFL